VRHSSRAVMANVHTPFGSILDLGINLVGQYQATNAGTAVMAAYLLRETAGLPVTEEAIRLAMRRVRIAGRMEVMQREPTVIIDGAHNPQKMRAAAQVLAEDYPQQDKVLVVGMLKTKDAAASLREILPHVSRVIATEPHVTGKPSFSAAEVAEMVRSIAPGVPVEAEADVQTAIRRAIEGAGGGEMVFVTGSIYMLGQARELWHPKVELLRELQYGPRPPQG
jgi:dihydrofolate synthase / folylpolyglutamate synthase